jgi:hypothetical protein
MSRGKSKSTGKVKFEYKEVRIFWAETVDDVNKFTEVIYMLGNNFAQDKCR